MAMTEDPRLCIGQEYLWMQGFPIEVINSKLKGEFHDTLFTNLAGNMCSTPVFLIVLCAAIASVDWCGDQDQYQRSHAESSQPVKPQRSLKQSFFDTRYEPPPAPGGHHLT